MGNYVTFQPKVSRSSIVDNMVHLVKEGFILMALMALTAGVFFVVTGQQKKDQAAQKQDAAQAQVQTQTATVSPASNL